MDNSGFYENGILKDFYSILQIQRNAEPEVISLAYKALAKKYHPDTGGSNEKMKLFNQAYDVLKDTEAKMEYDKLYDEAEAQKAIQQQQVQIKVEADDFGDKTQQDYFDDQLSKRILNENLSDNVYQVEAEGIFFNVPMYCACCLKRPETEMKTTFEFDENNYYYGRYRAILIRFPLCLECKKHIKEFAIKRTLLLFFSLIPSALLVLLMVLANPTISFYSLLLSGAVVTVASIFGINALLKVKVIEENHANRGVPVEIKNCNQYGTIFWFHNWFYAEKFAEDNGAQVIPVFGRKDGRNDKLLDGKKNAFVYITSMLLIVALITAVISIIAVPAEEIFRNVIGIIQN